MEATLNEGGVEAAAARLRADAAEFTRVLVAAVDSARPFERVWLLELARWLEGPAWELAELHEQLTALMAQPPPQTPSRGGG